MSKHKYLLILFLSSSEVTIYILQSSSDKSQTFVYEIAIKNTWKNVNDELDRHNTNGIMVLYGSNELKQISNSVTKGGGGGGDRLTFAVSRWHYGSMKETYS